MNVWKLIAKIRSWLKKSSSCRKDYIFNQSKKDNLDGNYRNRNNVGFNNIQ